MFPLPCGIGPVLVGLTFQWWFVLAGRRGRGDGGCVRFLSGAPVWGVCTARRAVAFSMYVAGCCGGAPQLWACFFPPRGVRGLDRVWPMVSVPCLGAVVCFGVPCRALLCLAVVRRAVPRCAVLCPGPPYRAVPCCVVSCLTVLQRVALCLAARRRVLLCCAMLLGAVPCPAALWLSCAAVCCAVLRCVVLCRVLLCCHVRWVGSTLGPAFGGVGAGQTGGLAVWVPGSGHVADWWLVGVVGRGAARWLSAVGGLGVPSGPVGQVGVCGVALSWGLRLGPMPSLGPCP